ncbi:MAG: signal peptidase I [Clostridia bacterium]|nr:signal peptidase I [Clostridia bacterium]
MMNGNTPSVEQLEGALRAQKRSGNYSKALRSTIYSLLVVAAVAILVATLVMPILHVSGSSMTPVIGDGDIAAVIRGSSFERGDVVAFYYNNKVLVKRVIAFAGEWVDIDTRGNVYINNELLDEPYLTEKALGNCDIKLPYQVPADKFFVLGDHRSTSADSRSVIIGPVSEEQILGKVFLRIWPLNKIGLIH